MSPSETGIGAGSARPGWADALEQKTGLNDAVLSDVVHTFYRRIRSDALLGPIFDARITDWDSHLERMVAFWSSVALMTGRYHGRPMEKHMSLPVGPAHFAHWLMLFEETAREICTPVGAHHLIERAHRIAASLQAGLSPINAPGEPEG